MLNMTGSLVEAHDSPVYVVFVGRAAEAAAGAASAVRLPVAAERPPPSTQSSRRGRCRRISLGESWVRMSGDDMCNFAVLISLPLKPNRAVAAYFLLATAIDRDAVDTRMSRVPVCHADTERVVSSGRLL
jgi:hypothetical protein